jgi:hypothetical protein
LAAEECGEGFHNSIIGVNRILAENGGKGRSPVYAKTGAVKDSFGNCGFAGVNVGDNADVSKIVDVCFGHNILSLIFSLHRPELVSGSKIFILKS